MKLQVSTKTSQSFRIQISGTDIGQDEDDDENRVIRIGIDIYKCIEVIPERDVIRARVQRSRSHYGMHRRALN